MISNYILKQRIATVLISILLSVIVSTDSAANENNYTISIETGNNEYVHGWSWDRYRVRCCDPTFAINPSVKVTDISGQPVADISVKFQIPEWSDSGDYGHLGGNDQSSSLDFIRELTVKTNDQGIASLKDVQGKDYFWYLGWSG